VRRTRFVVAAVVVALLGSGCADTITGTARPDPVKAPVAVTEDGNGIRAGFLDAPVEIEIYTEPQCSHCADLQADFGDGLASYIATGALAVTYRPLTFLDTAPKTHSADVVRALFAAATPAPGNEVATGPQFQHYVELLWKHQDSDASAAALADLARQATLPDALVDQIAGGRDPVDPTDVSDTNFEFLYQIDPVDTGTPTVFDLTRNERVDIYDDDWLSKLVSS
jgi:protein-disulfide isomerase